MTSILEREYNFWTTRADEALAKLRAIEERQRMLDSYGEDDFEDGSIITFQYKFTSGGIIYDYAALKARGLWYTTGPRSPKAYTWEQLIDWWSASKCPVELYYVKEVYKV